MGDVLEAMGIEVRGSRPSNSPHPVLGKKLSTLTNRDHF